ncbi:YncE family protein [Streptomyces sp. NPDC058794]|uniref:YncE family protein n=1 Tax=unclassified Streptomyces TaxID=2593676 RepID=UPI0036B23424
MTKEANDYVRIRQFVRGAALFAALSLSLLGLGTSTAAADTSNPLPISSYRDIAVDAAHQQVFLSDPFGDSVLVTDYAGRVVKQIGGADGAWGFALSGDSRTLYVALRDAGAIAAIDTVTLQETARYDTGTGAGAYAGPTSLALAGDRIWFGYSLDTWRGALGSLDLSGAQPVVTRDQGLDTFRGSPRLAATPQAPNTLVAAESDGNTAAVAVYDVGDGRADNRATRVDPGPDGCASLQDAALTPDGRQVVIACAAAHYHQVLRTADLADSGTYTTGWSPTAVAVDPSGTTAAGVYGPSGPDVRLFAQGNPTAYTAWDFPEPSDYADTTLVPGGLAWAPDGSRIFAVTETSGTSSLSLHVLDHPQVATTVTVRAPASSPRNQDLTLTGKLEAPVGFGAGNTVDIWRIDDPMAGEGTLIGSANVAADGTFSYTDVPRAKGQVQYTVQYYGDTRHAYAYGSVVVDVVSD